MTSPATRFDDFDIHTTTYKRIGNHEIAVGILVPRKIKPGKHPLLVKFHGGGLILGEAVYRDWFAAWFVPLILRNDAITVMPNYRLIPEHSGKDIDEDLKDFWTWLDKDFSTYFSSIVPGIEPDFEHILVSGESAGGLLAFQSVIKGYDGGKAKAVIGQYPMTNYLRRDPDAKFMGMSSPGPEAVDKHIASMVPGTVISSAVPPTDRMYLSFAMASHNRWLEFYGSDKDLLPIHSIENAKRLPPSMILHGEQDSAVSVEDSRDFVKKVGEVLGDEVKKDVRLIIQDGEHGFDCELVEEENEWLKEGLKFVEGKWLA